MFRRRAGAGDLAFLSFEAGSRDVNICVNILPRATSEGESPPPCLPRLSTVIPIFHDTWTYLKAPYVRGLRPNPFAAPQFKYAWIDTNWRPQWSPRWRNQTRSSKN